LKTDTASKSLARKSRTNANQSWENAVQTANRGRNFLRIAVLPIARAHICLQAGKVIFPAIFFSLGKRHKLLINMCSMYDTEYSDFFMDNLKYNSIISNPQLPVPLKGFS
jgi:hypothetical protein